MDDPVAADLATEATERTAELWTEAARDGLGDATLADAARRCLDIAAARVPAELGPAVADLAELVESGRCPGDLLAERIDRDRTPSRIRGAGSCVTTSSATWSGPALAPWS